MITDKQIDNVAQLQIIDDQKRNYRKESVISACNVDYGLNDQGHNQENFAKVEFLSLIIGIWLKFQNFKKQNVHSALFLTGNTFKKVFSFCSFVVDHHENYGFVQIGGSY